MMMIVKVALFLMGLYGIVAGCEMLTIAKTGPHQTAAFTVITLGGILISSAFIIEAVDKVRKSVDKTWTLLKDYRDKLDRDKPDS